MSHHSHTHTHTHLGGAMRVVGMLLLTLASVLLTASPHATAMTSTPFTADLSLQASFSPTTAPGVFTVTTSGGGIAFHLGEVTASSTETLDFATAPGTTVVRDGRMVLVAANGDELHWSYGGSASLPGPDGSAAISGSYTITGGTGRFSDAAGSGTISGSANGITGAVLLTYRGRVEY